MEEIARELRELRDDRKYDREMIMFMKERLLIAENRGKDNDLHCKIDKLLENQSHLERKVDQLSEELAKSQGFIAHFVEAHENLKEKLAVFNDPKNSKKFDDILDTVQTTEGYAELFVKDFDKIHEKLKYLEDGLALNSQQIAHLKDNTLQNITAVTKELKQFGDKLEDFEPKCSHSDETEENTDWKLEQISTLLTEMKERMENINFKETREFLENNESSEEYAPVITLKCRGCKFQLPEDPEFLEDGVTVECPNYGWLEIGVIILNRLLFAEVLEDRKNAKFAGGRMNYTMPIIKLHYVANIAGDFVLDKSFGLNGCF